LVSLYLNGTNSLFISGNESGVKGAAISYS
jgi:hypothetical protein